MATVTDVLLTLIQMKGGPAYSAEMQKAAESVDRLAASESRQKRTSGNLKSAFGELLGPVTRIAGLMTALVPLGVKAAQTFAEDEAAIFRTTVVLRNLGNSYPIERAQAFASELQRSVAIDDEAVVALIGLEKRFGIADDQIEQTTRTLVDFSKATGIELEQAGEIVGRALLGQTRGLRALGIQFEATGDRARDLASIQEKLNSLFGGAGAAERNTLAGSFTALRESVSNLLSALGERLATVLIPILNATIKLVDFLTSHLSVLTTLIGAIAGFLTGGPVGAIVGALAGLALGSLPGPGNAAAEIGQGKGGLATESTLAKIEQNTKQTADAFVKQVLGGPGSVARGAFTQRDARLAFGI